MPSWPRIPANGIRRTLARLLRLGLVEAVLLESPQVPWRQSYILTPLGFASWRRARDSRRVITCATRAASPATYAGLVRAAAGAREGSSRLPRGRGRGQVSHLAVDGALRRAHGELQALYLAFLRAARASHGRDALEEWRGEWACTRGFSYDGAYHVLRPDGYLRYRAGEQTLAVLHRDGSGTLRGGRRVAAQIGAVSLLPIERGLDAHGRRLPHAADRHDRRGAAAHAPHAGRRGGRRVPGASRYLCGWPRRQTLRSKDPWRPSGASPSENRRAVSFYQGCHVSLPTELTGLPGGDP